MHDTNLLEDQPIAWTPTPDVIERARLTQFMRQVGVSTWDELYEFSIRDVEKFTEEVLKFLDIKFDPPYEKLLDTSASVEFPKWFSSETGDGRRENGEPREQAGNSQLKTENCGEIKKGHAGLNIIEICLDRWDGKEQEVLRAYSKLEDQGKSEEADSLYSTIVDAVVWEDETGNEISVSYAHLARAVNRCATGLTAHGLKRGDAIGIHLPMAIETVVALIAIGRIGAIAVPVFSGYGVEAIASRMAAVNAKALFTCASYTRRGKTINAREVAMQAVDRVPSIGKVFVVSKLGEEFKPTEFVECGTAMIAEAFERLEMFGEPDDLSIKVVGWSRLLYSGNAFLEPAPEPTSAEDPLIILYTSGTTGKPKGIAHTHASFPIKAAQDMAFGTDVGRGTRICWYTDIGWMMGPWLIYGALINGATICIYDGAPDYPTPDRMWEFCAKHKVEVLGISPTLIRTLAASESVPPAVAGGLTEHADLGEQTGSDTNRQPPATAGGTDRKPPHLRHDLSSLRIFASTGEPWNPAPWWWLFEKVGNSKLPIINYSGGTEIAGGILMGNPLLPIKPCSFPAPCPGMDVDILDEDGKPVEPGKVGELVIKQPWIGMARGFWQEKERYLETYWRRFKDTWVHGDWAMRDEDGHWFILGRSDDTLKVAGKRVGPAEVESLLVAHPLVTEAAVIGVPDEAKGTAMVAFCVLASTGPQASLPASGGFTQAGMPAVQSELKAVVARDMGKPLTPSKIHFVSALPKTRNAKIMRRVIRAAYLGEDPGDLSALENPNSVNEIASARESKP